MEENDKIEGPKDLEDDWCSDLETKALAAKNHFQEIFREGDAEPNNFAELTETEDYTGEDAESVEPDNSGRDEGSILLSNTGGETPAANGKTKKKGRVIGFFSNLVTVLLVILIIALVFLNFTKDDKNGIAILGYHMYSVSTGSMEPAIRQGDMVVVKAVEEGELAVGDIITFLPPFGQTFGSLVTHRIIEVREKGKLFKTAGDANKELDGSPLIDHDPVSFDLIIGKVIYTIPLLGRVHTLFRGKWMWIAVPIVMLAAIIALEAFKAVKKGAPAAEKKRKKKRKS